MNDERMNEGMKGSDLPSRESLVQLAWLPSPRRTVLLSGCCILSGLLTSHDATKNKNRTNTPPPHPSETRGQERQHEVITHHNGDSIPAPRSGPRCRNRTNPPAPQDAPQAETFRGHAEQPAMQTHGARTGKKR